MTHSVVNGKTNRDSMSGSYERRKQTEQKFSHFSRAVVRCSCVVRTITDNDGGKQENIF